MPKVKILLSAYFNSQRIKMLTRDEYIARILLRRTELTCRGEELKTIQSMSAAATVTGKTDAIVC